jgi:hypothetical protein
MTIPDPANDFCVVTSVIEAENLPLKKKEPQDDGSNSRKEIG